MKLNYLKIMHLTTQLALITFVFIAIGLTLWIADMLLNWDILPQWIQNYAELLIISVSVLSILLIFSSLLTALVNLVERQTAQQATPAKADSFTFNKKQKMGFVIGLFIIVVVFVIFQKIDSYRKQQVLERDIQVFTERLERESIALESALADILPRMPESLLTIIAELSKTPTLEETKQPELDSFLASLNLSIQDSPKVSLLLPAEPPYRYMRLNAYTRYSDEVQMNRTFLLKFVQPEEEAYIAQLFSGEVKPLAKSLKGLFIDNTNPSAWGLIRQADKVIAAILLHVEIDSYYHDSVLRKEREFFHDGPDSILTN